MGKKSVLKRKTKKKREVVIETEKKRKCENREKRVGVRECRVGDREGDREVDREEGREEYSEGKGRPTHKQKMV